MTWLYRSKRKEDADPVLDALIDSATLAEVRDLCGLFSAQGTIRIAWDQWYGVWLMCEHGSWMGQSETITDATVSAVTKMRQVSHPRRCMAQCFDPDFVGDDVLDPNDGECWRWQGHEGDHKAESSQRLIEKLRKQITAVHGFTRARRSAGVREDEKLIAAELNELNDIEDALGKDDVMATVVWAERRLAFMAQRWDVNDG